MTLENFIEKKEAEFLDYADRYNLGGKARLVLGDLQKRTIREAVEEYREAVRVEKYEEPERCDDGTLWNIAGFNSALSASKN